MGAVRVLGIDVGGTFTDAVFFRNANREKARLYRERHR
jgi:N-methylhydantoinase A/oxoprolinase/acetone carboxylase beta subunit